jgi:hypothetical protein
LLNKAIQASSEDALIIVHGVLALTFFARLCIGPIKLVVSTPVPVKWKEREVEIKKRKKKRKKNKNRKLKRKEKKRRRPRLN